MDAERFTEAALQMVASAQQVARARQHQQITPLHLTAALLADPQGLPSRVVEKAGMSADAARSSVDAALEKLPKVTGGRWVSIGGGSRVSCAASERRSNSFSPTRLSSRRILWLTADCVT